MAFVVEDGTGLEDATSYVDLDYGTTYAESFFSEDDYDTWSNASDSELERTLNRATQYIDRTYVFLGEKKTYAQSLQFPRDYLYDFKGDAITDIPNALKQAVCLVAIRLLNGVELDPDLARGGRIVREKIDVIDITYSENAPSSTKFVEINNLLSTSGLIDGSLGAKVNIKLVQR